LPHTLGERNAVGKDNYVVIMKKNSLQFHFFFNQYTHSETEWCSHEAALTKWMVISVSYFMWSLTRLPEKDNKYSMLSLLSIQGFTNTSSPSLISIYIHFLSNVIALCSVFFVAHYLWIGKNDADDSENCVSNTNKCVSIISIAYKKDS